MKTKGFRIAFSIFCFLLAAFMIVAFLVSFYKQANAIWKGQWKLRNWQMLIENTGSAILVIFLAVSCLKMGIRQLHTNIKILPPPDTKFGTLKLMTAVFLQIIGIMFFTVAVTTGVNTWLRHKEGAIYLIVNIVMLAVLIVLCILCFRGSIWLGKKAFKEDEIELMGEKI